METELNLTDQERSVLQEIARRTSKTESDLICEAVRRLIDEFRIESRQMLLRKAKGMWKDRNDITTFEDLRRERERI